MLLYLYNVFARQILQKETKCAATGAYEAVAAGFGACLNTLNGHRRSELCLQYDDKYLVSGSSGTFGRVSSAQNGCDTTQTLC
jgi:hypothetical protein